MNILNKNAQGVCVWFDKLHGELCSVRTNFVCFFFSFGWNSFTDIWISMFFYGNPCLLAIYMLWTRKKTEKKLTPQLLDTWNRNSCLFSCFNILLACFISISNLDDDDDDDDKLSGSKFFSILSCFYFWTIIWFFFLVM